MGLQMLGNVSTMLFGEILSLELEDLLAQMLQRSLPGAKTMANTLQRLGVPALPRVVYAPQVQRNLVQIPNI